MRFIARVHASVQIVISHTFVIYVKREAILRQSATVGSLRAEVTAGMEASILQPHSQHHLGEAVQPTSVEEDNLALGEAPSSLFNNLNPAQHSTPINAKRLNRLLKNINYPIKARLFLFFGFVKGFRLGFRGTPNSDLNVNNRSLNQVEKQAINDTI